MTDKKMIEEIYKRLKIFMVQSSWLDENIPEQAGVMFTTLCIIGGIDADTLDCNNMLLELYCDAYIESIEISYEEFEEYMIKLIV